jgi:hypothetical protein
VPPKRTSSFSTPNEHRRPLLFPFRPSHERTNYVYGQAATALSKLPNCSGSRQLSTISGVKFFGQL